MSMTPLQHKLLAFIKSHLAEHGYSPSLAEMATAMGLSAKSVSLISRHIHTLIESGELKFNRKGYRNLALAKEANDFSLPFLGRIAAGKPIEAVEDRQQLDFSSLFKEETHFILQVKGDSMIEEGILNGDYVICAHTDHAREGDIVVALIDGQEATLKRISFQVADRVTLIPANPALKPKAYLPSHVQVQGKYIGLLRMSHSLLT